MREITDIRRHQQRSSPHYVVAGERYQHRVFNVVIERIAVADAVKSKSSS
jgi:hypothetical protein